MGRAILTNRVFQFLIRLTTALAFTLFIAYQIYLAIQIEESRFGRLLGVGIYALITIAAYLDLSSKDFAWTLHTILLVAGLLLLFAIRLLNIPTIVESFDTSSTPSILTLAEYIFSQLGTLVLAVGYLVVNIDMEERTRRRIISITMYSVIALYTLCFLTDCMLLLVYEATIDLNRDHTLISRFVYFWAFTGSAISFMLPAPKAKKNAKKQGEFYYRDEDDDDIELVL